MRIKCGVCPRNCSMDQGDTGFCRARGNREGKVVPLNYGRVTSMGLDPIEKKPLARFHPGSMILSVGSFGCNMACPFCQNHTIARGDGETPSRYVSPEDLATLAAETKDRGNIGVAFTYNEPLIGPEYIMDTWRFLKQHDLKTVLVTNGYASRGTLEALLPVTDAMNIDLKGFTDGFYKKLGGDLETVKGSISMAAGTCHLEVTTLVVPGENDSPEEIRQLAVWLASVDPDIPLHLSRFFPRYHYLDRRETKRQEIYDLAEIAGKYLNHVYPGNC